MAPLDLKINGDCASAVNALTLTERAVGSLQSRAGSGVGVAVSVLGARAAAKDLGSVSTAITNTNTAAAAFRGGGVISSGLGAGAVAARGFSSTLGGTSRAISETATSAGVLAAAVGRVGAAAARGGALAGMLPSGGAASIVAASAATQGLQRALAGQQLAAMRMAPAMAMANAQTSALAANSTAAAAGMNRMAASGGGFRGAIADFRGAVAMGMLPGVLAEVERAGTGGRYPGTGGPPPIIPPRGGGGGGGGGGAADDAEGERRGAAAGKKVGEIGKELGTMVMAGMALGIAADATVTKYGVDAVNKTIAETPKLAKASGEAMDEFGKGLSDVSSAVADKAVPAFRQLGVSQHALGAISGKIGMDNMQTYVEGQIKTTDAQTKALTNMQSAFGPAIQAADNLGVAMLKGISNPAVVDGVRSFSQVLAKPEIQKGLADITTGATGAGLVLAKVAADTSAAASKLVNSIVGGQNVTDTSGTLFGAGMFASLGFSKGGLKGGIAGAILGGTAIASSQNMMATGKEDMVTPSLISNMLGSAIGYRLGKIPGMIVGGVAGQLLPNILSNLPGELGKMAPAALMGAEIGGTVGMLGGPVGMAVGTAVGGVVGAAVGRGERKTNTNLLAGLWGPPEIPKDKPVTNLFTGKPMEEPVVTNLFTGKPMDTEKNAITGLPTSGPGSLGDKLTGGEGPKAEPPAVRPGLPSIAQLEGKAGRFAEWQITPGVQGPGLPPLPPLQHAPPALPPTPQPQQQQQQQEPLPAGVGKVGNQAPTRSFQDTTSAASAAASATAQLQQNAQQAAQSVSQLGQTMPAVAQAVQTVAPQIQPVQQSLADMPQQAVQQMNTAASSVGQSAQQMGAAVPPAVSAGIAQQTPQVCDSAAGMAASMVACAARALMSASPSKKFVMLGESTGQGLALGADNSAGLATNSVGNMITGVLGKVGALGSGVQAASDGVVPIAESAGLMVGYVWARSVETGVDSVLRAADFAQASMPGINSALAKTTLGQLGLLGPAGSGASIGKMGLGGMITLPNAVPAVNATIMVSVDGTPLRVIAQDVVEAAFGAAADSFDQQRG